MSSSEKPSSSYQTQTTKILSDLNMMYHHQVGTVLYNLQRSMMGERTDFTVV